MTRKTNAELIREEENNIAAETKEYPTILMKALEEATIEAYEITVENGQFIVAHRSKNETFGLERADATWAEWTFGLDYTAACHIEVTYLLNTIANERTEREAAKAKKAARAELLARMTPEERELLGFNG